jgi:uncharacterized membrane protein YccC
MGFATAPAQTSPAILQHGTNPPTLQQRGSLGKPQALAKSPAPAVDSSNLAVLIFCLKTLAAALLALFISFWLALDEPYWAVMTVFVVGQPDSGLVLAKGFYRLCGTAVGILVTTALVFGLAQYGELFIAALAAWIGVCSFAARGRRGFASYSFQLAGYTAAIVGLPAALNTDGAYTLIVARSTEITLGIACMGLVSRLILPQELAPKLTALAVQLFHRVDHFAELAIDPATRPEQPQWATRRLLRQVRVHLSRFAAAPHPAFSAFNFALCEQLASTLAKLKDEPALARACLLRGAIGLSSGWAIERLATGVDANRETAGISAEISGLLAGLSRVYLRPSWARLTRSAWDARVVSRRLLAKARAADKPTDSEALLVLAVACEALRSNLLKFRLIVGEERSVLRS